MVAKKVDVISRPAFGGDGKAHMWESDGLGSYTLSESSDEEPKRGTKIVVYLKDDAEEFAEKYRVEAIIRKHSAFVPFPVYVDGEHVNTQTALWREPKSQVKPEQYKEFYKSFTYDSKDPWTTSTSAWTCPCSSMRCSTFLTTGSIISVRIMSTGGSISSPAAFSSSITTRN